MSDILARLSVYAELGDLSCLAVHPEMPGYSTGGLLRDARDASTEIFKLRALVCDMTAAIQHHHDTKHGCAGGRSAAVLAPPDLALYTAAGIAHAVLGFSEGLDERRRMVRP